MRAHTQKHRCNTICATHWESNGKFFMFIFDVKTPLQKALANSGTGRDNSCASGRQCMQVDRNLAVHFTAFW